MADQIRSLDAALARLQVNWVVRRQDPCVRGRDAAVRRGFSEPRDRPIPLPFRVVPSDTRGRAPIVAGRWHPPRRRLARRFVRSGSESLTTKHVREFAGVATNDAALLQATSVENFDARLADAREPAPTDAGQPTILQHQPVVAPLRALRDQLSEQILDGTVDSRRVRAVAPCRDVTPSRRRDPAPPPIYALGCLSRPGSRVSRCSTSTAAGSATLSPTQMVLKHCPDPTAGGRPPARRRESRQQGVPASMHNTPSSYVASATMPEGVAGCV